MTENVILTKNELLVHAYQMELEAQERYTYLADLMEVHNNMDLVTLFRKLAWIEGNHAKQILEQMDGQADKELQPHEYKWETDESPEAMDLGDVDYLMTPRQALKLALKAEENAFKFFSDLLKVVTDPELVSLATEFAEEEEEHVVLMKAELDKYPEKLEVWRDDMDDAVSQD